MVDDSVEQRRRADEEVRKNLPPGVKLIRTLRGHTDYIARIAWSPDGCMLASPSADGTIRLWDANTGECLRTLSGHELHKVENDTHSVLCIAFDRAGRTLASGGADGKVNLWEVASGKVLYTLESNPEGNKEATSNEVISIAFAPVDRILAIGDESGKIRLWSANHQNELRVLGACSNSVTAITFDTSGRKLVAGSSGEIIQQEVHSGKILRKFDKIEDWVVSIATNPKRHIFASGGFDNAIHLWDWDSGYLLRSLEGHTGHIRSIAFESNGELIASLADDGEVRLWSSDSGECLAVISGLALDRITKLPGLAFHPYLPILATVGSDPETSINYDNVIHIYELDHTVLLGQTTALSITYTSAKIVLVGDSGVGKTGLGWRLAYGQFKEHSSTHGQQFWLLKQLYKQRSDGTQCEAVLWDLAGQDDYRLIHALFLDDADLALVLFDPTRDDDPLNGVEFWLKQLKVEALSASGTPTILIAARTDRGTPRLTQEELDTFCKQRGINAYLPTSAKEGKGIEELILEIQETITWDTKPATVTTETFKRIKDLTLRLKEDPQRIRIILTPDELRQRLEKTDQEWKFSNAEMLTAVKHLAKHGYVTRLKTSQGELRILLAPELLNNLAASFILEARRNQKGLGSLEEQQLLSGRYKFPELDNLTEVEKDILLDSAAVLFLKHNICFRETDPLNGRVYLVFPELINLKKSLIGDDISTEDGVAYTVCGAVENVYASLVVLMGYTQTFTRTNQWRDHARYEVGTGHVCGFRLEAERAGELDLVLYFGMDTPAQVRMLFQSLFESFLARRNLIVRRFEPVVCIKGHTLNRAVIRQKMSSGVEFAFCSDCGEKVILPKADQPIHLTRRQASEVEANRRAADQRSQFEQALFRLKNYVTEQKITVPDCFISYAWGNPEQEHWVERSLATDLQKAGINVVLDRWHNPPGSSIGRFIDRLEKVDRIVVVGTVAYRKKYDNEDPESGTVVAAECAQINTRMRGAEKRKDTIVPILLESTPDKSFPPCLNDKAYSDFSKPEYYFDKALGLLLSLYQIPPNHPVAMELRDSLVGQRER